MYFVTTKKVIERYAFFDSNNKESEKKRIDHRTYIGFITVFINFNCLRIGMKAIECIVITMFKLVFSFLNDE